MSSDGESAGFADGLSFAIQNGTNCVTGWGFDRAGDPYSNRVDDLISWLDCAFARFRSGHNQKTTWRIKQRLKPLRWRVVVKIGNGNEIIIVFAIPAHDHVRGCSRQLWHTPIRVGM